MSAPPPPQDTPNVDESFDEKKSKKRSFNPAKAVVGGITQGSKAVIGGVNQGTQVVRGGISQGKFRPDLSVAHWVRNNQKTKPVCMHASFFFLHLP